MAAIAADQLRIRLEGGLEVLERAQLVLEQLCSLCKRGWERKAVEVLQHLERWQADDEQRRVALTTAGRVSEAAALLGQLRHLEQTLLGRMREVLDGTVVARTEGFEPKLAAWAELCSNIGQAPLPVAQELASGAGFVRSREWMWALPASVAVFALGQPMLVFPLIGLGALWWEFSKRHMKWRVFRGCVELESEDEPMRRIPMSRVDSVSPVLGGFRLVALWDATLSGDESLYLLGTTLSDVHAEVKTRARHRDNTKPPLWLTARLHVGEPAKESLGLVLACPKGILFVGDHSYEKLWSSAVGGQSYATGAALVEALRSLPAGVFEEKFDELKGVLPLDTLHDWQDLGAIQLVVLGAERKLFIDCPRGEAEVLNRIRYSKR